MGRQTRFYAHPDDYAGLLSGLRSVGAMAIAHKHLAGEPQVVELADVNGSLDLYLIQPEYLEELRATYTAHPNWHLSVSDDSLVELRAWRPHSGVMRPGRVYFQVRGTKDFEFVDKPAEFVAFAEMARRWIRRWCQKREDLLLAPSLAARFDRGQVVRKGAQGDLQLLDAAE